MINLIWAQGRNGELGFENSLPWDEPKDMQHFKETTMGAFVVMGRKTFESIGKPLPGRINIVITRDPEPVWCPPGVWIYDSIQALVNELGSNKAFVIGGSEIFDSFMPFADVLTVTHIDRDFMADTFAPTIDLSIWHVTAGKLLAEDIVVREYTRIQRG